VDPGIGFGKTTAHNLAILRHLPELRVLGKPILVGPSRKGFIGRVLKDPNCDALPGTIGVSLALARQGVQVLRVHDVGPLRQALALFGTAGGYGEP